MGRPYVEIDFDKVERLSMVGCSAEEIAAELGVSERTIWRRCGAVLSRGAKKSHVRLRSALMKYALQGNPALLVFLAKVMLGMKEPPQDQVTVNVSQQAINLSPDQVKANLAELQKVIQSEAKRLNFVNGNGNGEL